MQRVKIGTIELIGLIGRYLTTINRTFSFLLVVLCLGGVQLGISGETFQHENHPPLPNGWDSYDPYFDAVSENTADLWDRGYRCEESTVTDCLPSLDNHFETEPVWVSSQLQNRIFGYIGELSDPVLNDRNKVVRYGYDDYLAQPLPLWKDIFDGQAVNRVQTIIRVLQDAQCNSLASSSTSSIEADLEHYCEAEELFKYAMVLDACVTSKVRLSEIRDDKLVSIYTTPYSHDRAGALVKKALFRETWIYNKCQHIPLNVVTDSGLVPLSLEQPVEEIVEVVQNVHDIALKIAAKAGNLWALRSYLPQGESLAYWQDLYAVKPSLTHRYLAALGSGLTIDERFQHAHKAYALLQDQDVDLPIYILQIPGLMDAAGWDWTLVERDEEAPMTFPKIETDSLSRNVE
ncbi:MAG: hypothetical protein OXC80_02155 [Gammaproteobacteria bacterium]|nr:hypothetical protein [Gammaproteobacteria bacterium]